MRGQAEIKWAGIDIDLDLRLRTLKEIAKQDVRIRYVFLKRHNIPSSYHSGGKLQQGHIYTHVIGELLEDYLPLNDRRMLVYCDQRQLKGIRRAEFKRMLRARMLPTLPAEAVFEVDMYDSEQNPNIQIADWITGAIAWKLEGKPDGDKCFAMIQNNIIGKGRELFQQDWETAA